MDTGFKTGYSERVAQPDFSVETRLPTIMQQATEILPTMSVIDTLKAWAKRIKRDGMTLWFAVKDAKTPWYAKAVGMLAVAYALSPIDLIPDFIPVLGYIDDLLLLPMLMWLAIRLLPADVLADCRHRAEAWMLSGGKRPRSMGGASLIIALWFVAAAALVALLLFGP